MVMMLDTMGTRYHMLPSQVLANATTLDLLVLEKALAYHNKINNPNKNTTPELTQEEMLAMVKRVKEKQ